MIYDLERLARTFSDLVPGPKGFPKVGDSITYGNDERNQFVHSKIVSIEDDRHVIIEWQRGYGVPFHGQKSSGGTLKVDLKNCGWKDGTQIMRPRTPEECAGLLRMYIRNMSVGDS